MMSQRRTPGEKRFSYFDLIVTFVVGVTASVLASFLVRADLYLPLLKDVGGITVGIIILPFGLLLAYGVRRYPRFFGRPSAIVASMLVFQDNQVLLVYDEHGMLVPPGDHVRLGLRFESLHQTAQRAVRSLTGVDVKFDKSHWPEMLLEQALRQLPEPFYVQLEPQLLLSEGHVFHHDFIYLGVPTGNTRALSPSAKWWSIEALDDLHREGKTYPNVIRVIRLGLKALGKEREG